MSEKSFFIRDNNSAKHKSSPTYKFMSIVAVACSKATVGHYYNGFLLPLCASKLNKIETRKVFFNGLLFVTDETGIKYEKSIPKIL